MAAIFQIRRGDSSNTSSLVNGELYLNNAENAFQIGTNSNPIKLLSLNTASFGDIILTGSAYISGDISLGGNIYLGDNLANDSVNVNSPFSGSIVPSGSNVFDLGSTSKVYRNVYANNISASAITGSLFGMGDPTTFSASVDTRLDYLEGPFSTSVDSRMDLLENAMNGSKRLYVSPDGNDLNSGSQHSPFKTIKAAVASLGSAIASNIQRTTIFVGSGNYTENNPIAVPPGVAIVGDTLRTVRLTASNPTKDYFHCHDGNYFYGLRFLDLKHPAFAFSFPCSTATATISGGGVSGLTMIHTESGYVDGESVSVIIEGPDAGGNVATATAIVSGGNLSINMVSNGSGYVAGEKPHVSIQSPTSKRPLIGTSPYIQNCSSITGPITTDGTSLSLNPASPNYAPLPYNVSDVRNASNAVIGSGVIDEQGAGGGIRIDGNLVSGSSPLESFVADAFTQVNQGGPGHLVINKGYAQFVSCFTTFCTYGFKTANGGFANISNSVIDFGAKGLISKTYFPQTYNTGSSLETKTSTVSGFVIDENGAGYTGSIASVWITGGGASVQATAEANVNANGSIDEIVLLTGGSGYTTQPSVTIATPTGAGAIQATTVSGKALISGVSEILMSLQSGSRGIDISSNMILNGVDYLVTDVAAVSGQANQRRVTTYPAPPSITTNAQIYFHQLSNISTGGLVMEYVGSGVTYNALPKFGGVPIRTREINEFAPGRVFYSTVDNIGNLKIGDFFAVNQLTGEVTIDANSFNLSGLNAIGPFKRNGVAAGVVLQEVSNNTTLLNSQGLYGEDTVPTQYAVKEYISIISSSLDGRLDKLEISSGSLNTFSSSALIRLTNLETTSGSHNGRLTNLESKSASVDVSLVEIHSYTSSLKNAITVTGVDTNSLTTIRGDFRVLGTSSIITSQHIHLDDNIIELNGTGGAFGGFLVRDLTGGSTVSGSLKWNTDLDRWEAGKDAGDNTEISKILLAGGDGVISSSAQLSDLNQFTSSANTRLGLLETSTGSLNTFSSSTLTRLGLLETSTGSLNTATGSLYISTSLMSASIVSLTSSVVALQSFSGNVNVRFDNLQTYTTSVDSRFTTLQTYTSSVDSRFTILAQVTSSLLSYTASANTWSGTIDTRFTTLGNYTASVNQTTSSLNEFSASVTSSLLSIYQTTSSLNQTTASLNSFSASVTASFTRMTASITDHEGRITYVEQLNGISGGNPLVPLNAFSTSINTFTSSTNVRLNNIEAATSSYETKGRGIVSGSSQIVPLLPTGVISGSVQILGGSGVWSGSAQLPLGVVSGSSQILGGSGIASGSYETTGRSIVSSSAQIVPLLPAGVISGSVQVLGGSGIASGSYETTGRSIVSSSAQIVPLLPAGVVSSSIQVITANSITLGTHTTGAYIQTITGTTNQITVAGSGLESADVTLSLPQNIHSAATPSFAGLTINGAITATGDITAYYTSDERLKENIQPITNALSKVESISGNEYNWKEGFDEIHTKKGNDIGVIAQEIQKILPQAVIERDNGYLGVNYEKIIPLLIQSIKELSAKVKELENK
jgi:hypothetical protein